MGTAEFLVRIVSGRTDNDWVSYFSRTEVKPLEQVTGLLFQHAWGREGGGVNFSGDGGVSLVCCQYHHVHSRACLVVRLYLDYQTLYRMLLMLQ